ncbi:hypothetical protein DES52_102253 [Deinococcus yavapaiensis KR-236]|uniref:Uncharacterized protein n=1 Tax=Deinococcus yavapaiensis KR-236 TaxID=694435 RepID=A0A318SS88_9DEIO|nr:hypothetical protein DES52_102253 [Deinococcus yavapaiensis KR-236]
MTYEMDSEPLPNAFRSNWIGAVLRRAPSWKAERSRVPVAPRGRPRLVLHRSGRVKFQPSVRVRAAHLPYALRKDFFSYA